MVFLWFSYGFPITHRYGPPRVARSLAAAPCRRRLGRGWAAEPGAASAPQVTSMGSRWGQFAMGKPIGKP